MKRQQNLRYIDSKRGYRYEFFGIPKEERRRMQYNLKDRLYDLKREGNVECDKTDCVEQRSEKAIRKAEKKERKKKR